MSSFEFYAGLAEKLEREGNQVLDVPDDTLKIVVRREPLGVCALITPWNVSLLLAEMIVCMQRGGSVIVKHQEQRVWKAIT